MEKVKINQRQAEAIEWLLGNGDWDIEEVAISHINDGFRWDKSTPAKGLIGMKDRVLLKSLYIGYEVEPEYPKEGNWVKYDTGSTIIYGQIDTTAFDDVIGNFSNGQRQRFSRRVVSFMTPSEIAEEKERRFFTKHNRDIWDLKGGDVLWDIERNQIVEVQFSGPLMDYKRSNYKVVCFKEKRLDREGGE